MDKFLEMSYQNRLKIYTYIYTCGSVYGIFKVILQAVQIISCPNTNTYVISTDAGKNTNKIYFPFTVKMYTIKKKNRPSRTAK